MRNRITGKGLGMSCSITKGVGRVEPNPQTPLNLSGVRIRGPDSGNGLKAHLQLLKLN